MDASQKTRQHETTIEIPAPVERVWEAISTASGVQGWYAPEARIDPREGGEYFISWGPGMEGPCKIEVYDEPKHLRVVGDRERTGNCAGPDGQVETVSTHIAVDFYLDSREASTVLRLVHSGFLASAEWDREFEATRKGWPIMLRILLHSLTHHPGVQARQSWFFLMKNMPMEDAWNAVVEALKGNTVVYSAAPEEFCATWNAMGQGLVYVALGTFGGPIGVSINVVLYGDAVNRVPDATQHWKDELDRALTPAPASSGA